MNAFNILIAGFGGQGVLFAGKFIVYAGLIQGRQVSWLPSYGPEMRGGTANCSVIISDEPIGSPIVTKPNILIAMNLPSLDRYEDSVEESGLAASDSSLIPRGLHRTDIQGVFIPASSLAEENGLKGLSNMIMVGKAIREAGICTQGEIAEAMAKTVPERKKSLFDSNMRAVFLGYNYGR
ncbi:MAG: 2-oxoacid:acceptor oxidoreductase family protein [Clostridiales bacterium]|jgi:2-oxoglutarate ferredoxin oxidoreductase subunit gamma|nr:2-oxoacid:acceptor oxidoreductase family protein [Clostridiales bacterium]